MTDAGFKRTIWRRKFEILRDAKTGAPTITREFAEYLVKNRDIPQEYFKLNDESHRKDTAINMGKIVQLESGGVIMKMRFHRHSASLHRLSHLRAGLLVYPRAERQAGSEPDLSA